METLDSFCCTIADGNQLSGVEYMAVDFLPLPGTPVEEIDTPAMIVDLDAAEANIRDMQAVVQAGGAAMRPHTKTTKSPYWAL